MKSAGAPSAGQTCLAPKAHRPTDSVVSPHAADATRGRRACGRRRHSGHLCLACCSCAQQALNPARANLAAIRWQVRSTSDADDLRHITDEGATAEHCHHRTLIRMKWQSAEAPRQTARAFFVVRQAQSAIFATKLVHGRVRLASSARRQGAARSAHVMGTAIGLLAGKAKMPHPAAHSRAVEC